MDTTWAFYAPFSVIGFIQCFLSVDTIVYSYSSASWSRGASFTGSCPAPFGEDLLGTSHFRALSLVGQSQWFSTGQQSSVDPASVDLTVALALTFLSGPLSIDFLWDSFSIQSFQSECRATLTFTLMCYS